MKVKELVKRLEKLDQEANIDVYVDLTKEELEAQVGDINQLEEDEYILDNWRDICNIEERERGYYLYLFSELKDY